MTIMVEEEPTKNEKKSCFQILKDDRRGWIICIASIFLNFIVGSVLYTFGLYIAEFRILYGLPMSELNWISLIAVCLSYILSPIPALIIRRCPKKGYMIISLIGTLLQAVACFSSSLVNNIHWMFLTFGITFGIGSCFIMMSSSLKIEQFFPVNHRYQVFAKSIFQFSYPAGRIIFTTVYAYIIQNYSWRLSLRFAGFKSILVGIIASFVLAIENPSSQDAISNYNGGFEKKNSTYLNIFRKPEIICWLTGMALYFATQLMALYNLPHYLEEEQGASKMDSSLSLTMISVFETITCIIISFSGKYLKGKLVYLGIIASLGLALIMFIWPSINPSYEIVLFLCSLLGFVASLGFSVMYPASDELMDIDSNVAWPITCTFCGIGSILGPLFSGVVYDHSNSYDAVFYTVGSMCIVNFLVFSAIPLIKHYKQTNYEKIG